MKTRPKNPRIDPHLLEDWCHLCGSREYPLADVYYPKNAEHGFQRTEYIRICSGCAVEILETISGKSGP